MTAGVAGPVKASICSFAGLGKEKASPSYRPAARKWRLLMYHVSRLALQSMKYASLVSDGL